MRKRACIATPLLLVRLVSRRAGTERCSGAFATGFGGLHFIPSAYRRHASTRRQLRRAHQKFNDRQRTRTRSLDQVFISRSVFVRAQPCLQSGDHREPQAGIFGKGPGEGCPIGQKAHLTLDVVGF
jgi:hypothetical protein